MRRVRAVASHLAAAVVEDEVLPLSAEAEAAFTRDGFCALQLTELPPEFHESFGAQMRELSENPPPPEQGWLSLEGQLLQVLRTPTFKGALQSLLGPDFQMAAPWANRPDQGGMIGLHITAGGGHDQQYHKVSRPCAPCSAISRSCLPPTDQRFCPGRYGPRQHAVHGARLAAAPVHHDVLPAWRLARDGAVSRALSHLQLPVTSH